ncbi:hypothetical protein [Nonomuraea bangladeshensis]|uniref:hypothetical protein n=1 Tax=Nonomuraea bangladeshensis TaxID=404385 RepID=UPI0031D35FB2
MCEQAFQLSWREPMHLPSISRRLTILCATLLLTAGLAVSQATTATAADSITDLNLGDVQGSGDTAAAGGKVFIAVEDRIVVASSQGVPTGAITGLAEPWGLASSADGTRLYAALRGSHELAEIDTATLAITRRIDLTAYPCPSRLERSADRLWVSYGCPAVWGGGVLSLDMSETTPQPVPLPISQTSGASVIAAAANTLLVAENTRPQVYDLQNGTPALRGVIDTDDLEIAHGWEDLAITADGTKVYATPGSINDFEAWDLTTLSLIRSYGREEGIYNYRAIAVSPDGTRVAASHGFGGEEKPVALFDTATGAKIETFAASLHDVLRGSFTFSGTDLFAVTEAWSDVRHSYLWRMHGALLPVCKLTLTGPAAARKYSTATFTGRLTEPDGSDPTVRQLAVSFREMGQVTTLPDVTTNADGTFTFTHVPYTSGNLTYIVYRENTPDTRSCTASTRVSVRS